MYYLDLMLPLIDEKEALFLCMYAGENKDKQTVYINLLKDYLQFFQVYFSVSYYNSDVDDSRIGG